MRMDLIKHDVRHVNLRIKAQNQYCSFVDLKKCRLQLPKDFSEFAIKFQRIFSTIGN